IAAVALLVAAAALVAPRPYRKETRLPAGVLEIHSEIVADSDLAGHPSGSILRMAPDFHGRAAIVVRSNGVRLRDFTIVGSRDPRGRNNTTGGILLEEGTMDFRVTDCHLSNIRGNGIWTHSLYTSPRNGRGVLDRNSLFYIGRDALQVGHAFDVHVDNNHGG